MEATNPIPYPRAATIFLPLFLFASLGLAPDGRAQSLVVAELPVTIFGSTPATPGFEVGYFTDDDLSTDYASNGGGTNTHVDFQFSTAVPIGSVLYTDRTSSGFFNGSYFGGPYDNVYSYRLIFSNEPTFTTVLWSQDFASPDFANTDPLALINGGSGITAQFVRWQVTATEGGNPGGAEIHFFTPASVPEPAAAALLGLGLVLLASTQRRTASARRA